MSAPGDLEGKILDYERAITSLGGRSSEASASARLNGLKHAYAALKRAGKDLTVRLSGDPRQTSEVPVNFEQFEAHTARIEWLVAELEDELHVTAPSGQARIVYMSDSRGRPWIARGGPLSSIDAHTGRNRDARAQRRVTGPLTANGIFGYNASHLIADVLGGSGGEENLVPMRARVNNSWMGTLERIVRARARAGANVHAEVRALYHPKDMLAGVPEAQRAWMAGYAALIATIPDLLLYSIWQVQDGREVGREDYTFDCEERAAVSTVTEVARSKGLRRARDLEDLTQVSKQRLKGL
jgi:hypothetical protein